MANDKREQARDLAILIARELDNSGKLHSDGDWTSVSHIVHSVIKDAGHAAATAEDIPQADGWVDVAVSLPPAKEGWNHSEQCLVWYQPSLDAVGNYGIAYYHYDPPYRPCEWVDFAHLGRDPIAWQPLPTPYQRQSSEGE